MARLTGEGVIKQMVRERLEQFDILPAHKSYLVETEGYKPKGWYFMPVSLGMGTMGIPDFVGCYKGKFFSIETKSDTTKSPTKLQRLNLNCIAASKGAAYVVRDKDELDAFEVGFLLNG